MAVNRMQVRRLTRRAMSVGLVNRWSSPGEQVTVRMPVVAVGTPGRQLGGRTLLPDSKRAARPSQMTLAVAVKALHAETGKHIIVSPEVQGEKLQPNPVAFADAQCPAGFKALFGYGSSRRATTVAFGNRNAI